MEYEDFIKKITEADIYLQEDRDKNRHSISIKWITGGITGGGYWNEAKSDELVSAEPEPEFTDLDKIFELICPDITFLKYKFICAKVILSDTDRYDDYYGNHTNYARKTVYMDELFDALKEKGLIE